MKDINICARSCAKKGTMGRGFSIFCPSGYQSSLNSSPTKYTESGLYLEVEEAEGGALNDLVLAVLREELDSELELERVFLLNILVRNLPVQLQPAMSAVGVCVLQAKVPADDIIQSGTLSLVKKHRDAVL